MRRLFGTDGIRAPFGEYPLDRATVTHLGHRLGEALARESDLPSVVLGGDTRDSTAPLCRWLASGLEATGVKTLFGGVMPTPAIASLIPQLGADAGIAVSASHNPHPDNGIKLFDRNGFKWDEQAESRLESQLAEGSAELEGNDATLEPDPALAERYLGSLRRLLQTWGRLDGLRIVVDAANGAASPFAARLFQDSGAEVVSVGDLPDGRNINDGCGSTSPEAMARTVVEQNADLGVAFDGDADRAIVADEKGQVRDGDAVLFLWARELMRAAQLDPPRVVATSMSNLGLERALAAEGVSVARCDVGDRVVVATMKQQGILLGGEQSGHIVNLGLSTTGDGLITALKVAATCGREKRPLSILLEQFRRYPQILRNVRVSHKPDLHSLPRVASTAREVEERLGSEGRLVLRYSGTESLARVMIEGADRQQIETLAESLISAIQEELGEG